MDNFNDSDYELRTEAVRFFRSLINRRINMGIDTRPVNFAGNIGRHMSPKLKKWFLNKYPNNSDYVKFFLENDSVFHYDCISGNVSPNTGAERNFTTPPLLTKLEIHCSEPSITLTQLSTNVFEMEFFIVVFKSFVESYKLKKSYELTTRQLSEEFSDIKYQMMFKGMVTIVANPMVDSRRFETNLMDYLENNYSEVFAVDKHRHIIRLQLQVIEGLKKICQTLDDTIYKVFEYLLAKYLEVKGPKDVDVLFEAISKRHPFIVSHIFEQNITADDYTLLEFCEFNQKTFGMKRVDAPDGTVQRLIDILRPDPVIEPVVEPVVEEVEEEVIEEAEEEVVSDEEIYVSDDDIYISDEDEIEIIENFPKTLVRGVFN